jgi:hypothetical protein
MFFYVFIYKTRIFVSFYCTFPLWVQIPLDTTLCDEVCQWFAAGLSPGTPVSFTNKTDRHDITEILLNVVLNTITLTLLYNHFFSQCSEFCFQYCFFYHFLVIQTYLLLNSDLSGGLIQGIVFCKWNDSSF